MLDCFSRLAQLAGERGGVDMSAFHLLAAPRGTLEDVVTSTSGLAALTTFAEKRSDARDLRFLAAVQDFRRVPTRQKAEAIMARFVSDVATEQLGVGTPVRNAIRQLLQSTMRGKKPPEMFDEVYGESLQRVLQQGTFELQIHARAEGCQWGRRGTTEAGVRARHSKLRGPALGSFRGLEGLLLGE